MNTLDSYWEEADSRWDLRRLYQDLSKSKGRILTALQKAVLRAALCNVALGEVAKSLNRGSKGLRTDLSNGLYRFVESLVLEKGISHKGRIYWQQLPRLLALAGYDQQSVSPLRDALRSISDPFLPSDGVTALDILEKFERHRLNERLDPQHADPPLSVFDAIIQEGALAYQRQDFAAAIRFYRMPLEHTPACVNCLVEIALCFDQLGQYADSVEIALAALTLAVDKADVGRLHGILGSTFSRLALHTLDEVVLWQALAHYEKSVDESPCSEILSAWHRFELLERFNKLEASMSDVFALKAKLAFYDLKAMVSQTIVDGSDASLEHIGKAAQQMCADVEDEWLRQELHALGHRLQQSADEFVLC